MKVGCQIVGQEGGGMIHSLSSMSPESEPGKIKRDLGELVEGEILFSEWERAIYATDASAYEVLPLCVVLPKSKADIVKVVSYASAHQIPIIARGAGSGVVGQAIGSGIILDLTKYLNNVLNVDIARNLVTVEAGAYKSILDRELRKYGKFVPPDPTSSSYCTVGGMVGTNASGPHSVKYGTTLDYVDSLEVILFTGEIIKTKRINVHSEDWTRLAETPGTESSLYLNLYEKISKHVDSLKNLKGYSRKNASGYRVEHVLDGDAFDIAKIFVASEGTLGIITEVSFRLVDLPKYRTLALLFFNDVSKIGKAIVGLLSLKPSAVELIDQSVLKLGKAAHPELVTKIPSDTKSAIIAEFEGQSEEEANQPLSQLNSQSFTSLATKLQVARTEAEKEDIWQIRKKALPLVQKARGKKPVGFIEDAAVEPEKVGAFLMKLYEVFAKYDVQGTVYGHAGEGHLHARPFLDLKSSTDIKKIPQIAQEIFEYVVSVNGTLSAEHGDGLARSGFLQLECGQEVYSLYCEIKDLFDPRNILNPGKKVRVQQEQLVSNLRYGSSYVRRPKDTMLNWALKSNKLMTKITGYSEELEFQDEIELCHGCGVCRPKDYSVRMCPVFKGLGNEISSCRGRNNLLRWMGKLQGLTENFQNSPEYGKAIYENCIQCKMCQVECPSNVNVAKLMAEARAKYASKRGLPKGYQYFMDIDMGGEVGCSFSTVANHVLKSSTCRLFMEWITGISRQRTFPAFAPTTFRKMFEDHANTSGFRSHDRKVVFFYDTYINYNNPKLGMQIVTLLDRLGIECIVPLQKSSGLPALVEGKPNIGRKIAEYNVNSLVKYARQGIPILSFSPSAGLTLKMEYLNVLDTPDCRLVADSTFDLHEFLYDEYASGRLKLSMRRLPEEALIHFHCHHIVQKVTDKVIGLLRLIPEFKFEILERGCCGVGGSYSFIKDNFEKSMMIGNDLFRAIESSEKPVYSTGESCMMQMAQGSGKPVGLTMELLGKSLESP